MVVLGRLRRRGEGGMVCAAWGGQPRDGAPVLVPFSRASWEMAMPGLGVPTLGEQPPAKQPAAARELKLMLTRAGKLLVFK